MNKYSLYPDRFRTRKSWRFKKKVNISDKEKIKRVDEIKNN